MIGFLAVIFNKNLVYFKKFLCSLENQSHKDFSLILFNDGCSLEILESYLVDFSLDYKIINLNLTSPVKIRQRMIRYIADSDIDIAVFGDTDDYFDENRIEVCVKKLKIHDIVVNDLILFKGKSIIKKDYLSKRFANNSDITIEDILDKNIFGLSNTAIKSSIINEISFEENLIAVDWFLFSQFLLKKATAIFTSDSKTFYRQHSENTVGLGNQDYNAIMLSIRVKKIHYEIMEKIDKKYKLLLTEIIKLEKKISNRIFPLKNKIVPNLLWWENTALVK